MAKGTIRQFALKIVRATSLDEKLEPAPAGLTDAAPGPALRLEAPGRPPNLRIVPATQTRVPSIEGMADPAQRRKILHALANHEFQAAELFAWALVAFADAPPKFRQGLLEILDDEQRHTRMYLARLRAAGAEFGDFPVSGYFWNKVGHIRSPLDFICAMSLTFENANLDHTVDYAAACRRVGDEKTAAVIDRIGRDEVEHVRFGWTWLQVWKGERSAWDAWRESLVWPLRPAKAKGQSFNRRGREAAGLDEDFIRRLEASEP